MPSLYHSTIGEIKIDIEEKQTSITTNNLTMKSINQGDLFPNILNYCTLLRKKENTLMFRYGKPWSVSDVVEFVKKHATLWNQHDPFSAFAVYEKDSGVFIGTLNLYYKEKDYKEIGSGYPNVVEIGYVIDNAHWGKKFGTELATVAKGYIEYLTFELSKNKTPTRPIPTNIVATAHPGNTASVKILEKTLGGREEKITEKFGGQPRAFFFSPRLKTEADTPPPKVITKQHNKDGKKRLPTVALWTIAINPETSSAEKKNCLERMRSFEVDAGSLPKNFIRS